MHGRPTCVYLDTVDIGAGKSYPVHCRMYSCIPGLYSLDASSNPVPELGSSKMSPDMANVPRGQITVLSSLRTTVLENLVRLDSLVAL